MGYCFMTMQKIKSKAVLNQAYNHEYRVVVPPNADPSLIVENDIAIPVQSENGYVGAFEDKLKSLDYYKDHNFRKNGVMAYDVVMTFSREDKDNIDIDQWEKDNVEWLKKTFDNEYGANVVSCVFHKDEPGNIHAHAIVIPVDDRGHINARYYTGSKQQMVELQNSYAKAMEPHNLKRGLQDSKASHTDIKRFYATLNNAIYGTAMPEQEKDEDIDHYIGRIKDSWRTERAAHMKEVQDLAKQNRELQATYNSTHVTDKDVEISILSEKVKALERADDQLIREFGSPQNAYEMAKAMQLLNEGIENYPDEEAATKASEYASLLIEWAENRERQKALEAQRDKESKKEI